MKCPPANCDPILENRQCTHICQFHFITFLLSTRTNEWTDQVIAFLSSVIMEIQC